MCILGLTHVMPHIVFFQCIIKIVFQQMSYFVSRLYSEEDVWQQGFWAKGAIECNQTSQEGPEHHQNV